MEPEMTKSHLALALISIASFGCSAQIGNLSVAATKNIEFSQKKKVLVQTGVEGEDIKSIIIMFPTGQSQVDKAISNAVSSVGGDYMENARITNKFWLIPYIYGRVGFKVTGDVYRLEVDSTK